MDIIEHPERYDMPCLVPEGYRVDAVVEWGDAFSWRGIDFYIEQHPGQTLYHHIIRFEVDGLHYLCIGDNISGLGFREQRDFIHSFIPKNRTPVSSYTDMPRQILDAQPDILLTGAGWSATRPRWSAGRCGWGSGRSSSPGCWTSPIPTWAWTPAGWSSTPTSCASSRGRGSIADHSLSFGWPIHPGGCISPITSSLALKAM
jgi:hypothetical protein